MHGRSGRQPGGALRAQSAANDGQGLGHLSCAGQVSPQPRPPSCHLLTISWETSSKNARLGAVDPQNLNDNNVLSL